jgi:chemotaxis protein methyltransferase CheR
MQDHHFQQLLNKFELSWDGYRKVRKGVQKRIGRHMQQLGCRSFSTYLSVMDENEETSKECQRLLTVSISRFFRDYHLWQIMENEIFPALVKRERKKITVWSAGCACGEEVYSLRIVWDRMKVRSAHLPELEIMATDLNSDYIEKAQAGIYPASSLQEVPAEIISCYFEKIRGKSLYAVKPSLKSQVTWKVHNILSDPPKTNVHIILLRNNLLTYYANGLIKPALSKILDCLAPAGALIIGSHEKLPFRSSDLSPQTKASIIYYKKDMS